jgi:ribosomal protein S18 acetylase RimI-like enzyme
MEDRLASGAAGAETEACATSAGAPDRAAEIARSGYAPRFSLPHQRDGSERAWPLPPVQDELSARVVDPRLWDPMRRFWAGPSEEPASAEVNESARKLYAGHLAPQESASEPFQRIVALTRSSGALVGWCGILRRHLGEQLVPLPPGAYLFAIATDHAYRGQTVSFDGNLMRPGSALLLAALRQVERDWDGVMPYVWARVRSANESSQRLFDRHGFLAFSSSGEETLRVRPAGLPPR